MLDSIPGLIPEDGREFFYIEIRGGEGFSGVIDGALDACPDVPLPVDGGVIEEKAVLVLAGARSLLAISYRGDLVGWRRKFVAYCEQEGRMWGLVTGTRVALSNGTQLALEQCKAVPNIGSDLLTFRTGDAER